MSLVEHTELRSPIYDKAEGSGLNLEPHENVGVRLRNQGDECLQHIHFGFEYVYPAVCVEL